MNLDRVIKQLAALALFLIVIMLGYSITSFFVDILRLIFMSIFTAYLLYPLVKIIERRFKNRIYSIILIYVLIVISGIVGMLLVVPEIISQTMTLSDNLQNHLPIMLNSLRNMAIPYAAKFHYNLSNTSFDDVYSLLSANLFKFDPTSLINQMGNVAGSTIILLTNFITFMIITFYLLLDAEKLDKAVLKYIPQNYQERFSQMILAINLSLNNFFQGQIVLALVFSGIILILLLILGVHYALALTAFLAFWEIVPVVGPPIGFIPIFVSVGLKGMDNIGVNRLSQIILIFIIFNFLQWIKDNIVAPKYVGNIIGLHPVIIIISILLGAKFDGLAGIIISLPIACIIHEFIHFLRINHESQH